MLLLLFSSRVAILPWRYHDAQARKKATDLSVAFFLTLMWYGEPRRFRQSDPIWLLTKAVANLQHPLATFQDPLVRAILVNLTVFDPITEACNRLVLADQSLVMNTPESFVIETVRFAQSEWVEVFGHSLFLLLWASLPS
jgi:hypothetical protein